MKWSRLMQMQMLKTGMLGTWVTPSYLKAEFCTFTVDVRKPDINLSGFGTQNWRPKTGHCVRFTKLDRFIYIKIHI